MTRGVPDMDDSATMVRWPTQWKNTGEGGLAVFLVVPEDEKRWMECCVALPTIEASDVLVNGQEVEERLFPGSNRYQRRTAGDESDLTSVDLLACVCLGTTGGSYYDENQGYFQATKMDLTPSGLYVYNMLKGLYRREPELLTFLDT